MTELVATPVFKLYVASLIVLVMNLLVLANNTALSRLGAKEAVNPEDVKEGADVAVVFDAGNSKTQRYRRAHRNALENVPLFMITGLLVPLTGVSFGVAAALFGVFVSARVLHSIFYMRAVQPLRSLMFFAGALSQLALLGVVGYRVFFS